MFVFPVAVLMQSPDASLQLWEKKLSVVYPRMENLVTGVPPQGHAKRAQVLDALRVALQRLHYAGVVHLDLFP